MLEAGNSKAVVSTKQMSSKDDYSVLQTIGSGQFGVCKKVRRHSDGRIFVWKEIDYGMMNEEEKKLLCQEVNLLRDLRHEYIVRYYDRIIDRKTCTLYLVMEWCEGGDLNAIIQRHKVKRQHIGEEFVWQVLFQTSLALKECNTGRKGRVKVIHRDVKPANIFLDENKNVKVGDFGLARIFKHNTSLATSFVGTPYYMAPEVLEGRPYDAKSDLWSLGCVVHELCTLSPPFLATNQRALAAKVATGKVKSLPSPYSSELQMTVMKLLQVNPDLRPDVDTLLKSTRTLTLMLKEKELGEMERKLAKWQRHLEKRELELDAKERELKRTSDTVHKELGRKPLLPVNKPSVA